MCSFENRVFHIEMSRHCTPSCGAIQPIEMDANHMIPPLASLKGVKTPSIKVKERFLKVFNERSELQEAS